MLLGARQFFEKRGSPSWTNPYVKDGLVAMWDGEWNAGGGVHDSTKRAVDLSGNSRDLALSSACTIGDNYFALAPSASESRIGGTVSIPDLAGQTLLEFRIVAKYNGTSSWNRHCFFSSENTLYELNYSHFSSVNLIPGVLKNNNTLACQYQGSNSSTQTILGGVVFGLDAQCRQVDYDGRGGYTVWINNGSSVPLQQGTRQSSDTSTDFHILKMATSNVDQTGYIYSFAIYNRHLTDAERAANYAVDKERFGLP